MHNVTLNHAGSAAGISTHDRQAAAQQLTEQYPIIKKAQEETTPPKTTGTIKDPLDLIDELLGKYLVEQTNRAESMADSVKTRSNAISEISRLWGLVMQETMKGTNPNDNGKTVKFSGPAKEYLQQIDKIITDQLKDKRGISAITGKNLDTTKNMSVNYTDLQSLDATVTAFNDTIQVDIDTEQQRFRNVMTEISSAQEEIRDVRQVIIRLSQAM
ncbi:hypothetical protein AL542_15630 [Grimontia hollisae]|uniref:Uncharacterized protein n=1 Tax=Grimontia hollisae CIP 101886 TaxID=675812 RepID=D0I6B1_GRIHO|nr:hypothetical protein [Grimontia hollisae]AMG31620.1 hypothetical protein AL542_15630 [Grimontia hollisae]EEY72180.1 hypothetical protein VHA_001278 [Grimontia hollisae CIP 101886]STO45216.1 Uncharacterised protein [Grimontia hollisae]